MSFEPVFTADDQRGGGENDTYQRETARSRKHYKSSIDPRLPTGAQASSLASEATPTRRGCAPVEVSPQAYIPMGAGISSYL